MSPVADLLLHPLAALRQVNVINFTVTRSGLEEQLLSDVVSREKPDIETKKNRLLVTMAADKKQLRVCAIPCGGEAPAAACTLCAMPVFVKPPSLSPGTHVDACAPVFRAAVGKW